MNLNVPIILNENIVSSDVHYQHCKMLLDDLRFCLGVLSGIEEEIAEDGQDLEMLLDIRKSATAMVYAKLVQSLTQYVDFFGVSMTHLENANIDLNFQLFDEGYELEFADDSHVHKIK